MLVRGFVVDRVVKQISFEGLGVAAVAAIEHEFRPTIFTELFVTGC